MLTALHPSPQQSALVLHGAPTVLMPEVQLPGGGGSSRDEAGEEWLSSSVSSPQGVRYDSGSHVCIAVAPQFEEMSPTGEPDLVW